MADIPIAKYPIDLTKLDGADTATDGQVPTADGAGGVAWETPSGGGAGSLVHDFVTPTSGSTSINTGSSWANLSAHIASFTDLTIAAAAGDTIAVTLGGLWDQQATQGRLDVATIIDPAGTNTLTNYITTGTSSPAVSGFRGWIGLPASTYVGFSGTFRYTLQAGDIDAGNVTLRPRVWTSGAKTLFHDPGQFAVVNLGA